MADIIITVSNFRADFKAFADEDTFPDDQINFWLTVATSLMNPVRWRGQLGLAIELFTAHNVALEAQAQIAADSGGIPGVSRGVVASEAGGSLSVGYDTASALVPGAGHWNLTIYGTRLMWLVSMFGAGPIQVGVGMLWWRLLAGCTTRQLSGRSRMEELLKRPST